ncbi:unnamed protein product, partial [Symbiodinium sp. KB8]
VSTTGNKDLSRAWTAAAEGKRSTELLRQKVDAQHADEWRWWQNKVITLEAKFKHLRQYLVEEEKGQEYKYVIKMHVSAKRDLSREIGQLRTQLQASYREFMQARERMAPPGNIVVMGRGRDNHHEGCRDMFMDDYVPIADAKFCGIQECENGMSSNLRVPGLAAGILQIMARLAAFTILCLADAHQVGSPRFPQQEEAGLLQPDQAPVRGRPGIKAYVDSQGSSLLEQDVPVPIEEDGEEGVESLPTSPGQKRAGVEMHGARKGSRTDGKGENKTITLDVDSLRALLREQSDELLGRQREQLDAAIGDLEGRTLARVEAVQDQVQGLTGRQEDLEGKVESLERGLAELTDLVRNGGRAVHVTDRGDLDEKRKMTLVVGGWPKDSKRRLILHDLQQAIEALGLQGAITGEPFVTGPRRSVALVPMPKAQGESDQHHRDRMFGVVQKFSGSEVLTKDGAKLWCAFSKTQEQRIISGHAALIKRVVAAAGQAASDLLDFEWKTGTTWSDEGMVGSACLPVPPGVDMRKVVVFEETTQKHWVDLTLLSRLTQRPVKETAQLVEEQKRCCEINDLEQHFRDGCECSLSADSLLTLQEIPRDKAGWSKQVHGAWTVVCHRAVQMWRRVGIGYRDSEWALLRRVWSGRGVWVQLKHLSSDVRVWVGTAHFTPGCSLAQYEGEVEECLHGLPAHTGPTVFQCDANAPFHWGLCDGIVSPAGRDVKANALHGMPLHKGLEMVPPMREYMNTPTSRPRQEGRNGHIIDMLACKRVVRGGLEGGKSVGSDGTSKELLLGICGLDGGKSLLLEFLTRVLTTQEIPEQWNVPLMKGSWANYNRGPTHVSISGVRVDASSHLEVMGLDMRVGMSMTELIGPLLTRARNKFWANKHLLRSNTSLRQRIHLLERTCGGAALWCVAALPPDRSALGILNACQMQLVFWAMRLGKRLGEGWENFHKRAYRSARSAIHAAGLERWGTTWLRRWWRFSGHRARGQLREAPPISSHLDGFRTLEWWQAEQRRRDGLQHARCAAPWDWQPSLAYDSRQEVHYEDREGEIEPESPPWLRPRQWSRLVLAQHRRPVLLFLATVGTHRLSDDAVSAMQTSTDLHDEPDRSWEVEALEIRDDISMMLRNMVQNDETGEACNAASQIYRHIEGADSTTTGSLQWVSVLLRPELNRYILRVNRPYEYELDEDMQGWVQQTLANIDKCAWHKDRGVLAFRERRKRRRVSMAQPPQGSAQTPPIQADNAHAEASSSGATSSHGDLGLSAIPPRGDEDGHAGEDTCLMAGGRPKRSRSPVRRGSGGGSAGKAGGSNRGGMWRDWNSEETWERSAPRTSSSHRVLAPRVRREESAPSSSSRDARPRYECATPRATPPVDPAAPTPLTTLEAVDLWRQLLGISNSPSMGEMDRAVQQGGRALGRDCSDNMVDTLREMDAHDLSMMTVGLVDLVRRLMMECAQILSYASNDLVEVEVETAEPDHQSLMQAPRQPQKQQGMSATTPATVLTDLRDELQRLQALGWDVGPHVSGLLRRLRSYRIAMGNCELLDLLDSLLITFASEGAGPEDDDNSRPVLDWLHLWWPRVCSGCPASSTGSTPALTHIVDTQLDEADEMVREEQSHNEELADLARTRDLEQAAHEKEETEWEEAMMEAYDEHRHGHDGDSEGPNESTWQSEMERIEEMYHNARRRRRSQTDWRSWDNWALFDEMTQPRTRHRRWVEVDVAPTKDSSGEAKRLKLPIPQACGLHVQVTAARVVALDPTSSNTSSTVQAAQLAEADPQCGSSPAVPHVLEYADYSEQLERYRRGEVTGSYIEAMWGEQVWDLMQAQMEIERLEHDVLPQGDGPGPAGLDAPEVDVPEEGCAGVAMSAKGVQSEVGRPAQSSPKEGGDGAAEDSGGEGYQTVEVAQDADSAEASQLQASDISSLLLSGLAELEDDVDLKIHKGSGDLGADSLVRINEEESRSSEVRFWSYVNLGAETGRSEEAMRPSSIHLSTLGDITSAVGSTRSYKVAAAIVGLSDGKATEWSNLALAGTAFIGIFRNASEASPARWKIYSAQPAQASITTMRSQQAEGEIFTRGQIQTFTSLQNDVVQLTSSGDVVVQSMEGESDFVQLAPVDEAVYGVCNEYCAVMAFDREAQVLVEECVDGTQKTYDKSAMVEETYWLISTMGKVCRWSTTGGAKIAGTSHSDTPGSKASMTLLPSAYFQDLTLFPVALTHVQIIGTQATTCEAAGQKFALTGSGSVYSAELDEVAAKSSLFCKTPVMVFGMAGVGDTVQLLNSPSTSTVAYTKYANGVCDTEDKFDKDALEEEHPVLPDGKVLEWKLITTKEKPGVCNVDSLDECFSLCSSVKDCKFFATHFAANCKACLLFKSCQSSGSTSLVQDDGEGEAHGSSQGGTEFERYDIFQVEQSDGKDLASDRNLIKNPMFTDGKTGWTELCPPMMYNGKNLSFECKNSGVWSSVPEDVMLCLAGLAVAIQVLLTSEILQEGGTRRSPRASIRHRLLFYLLSLCLLLVGMGRAIAALQLSSMPGGPGTMAELLPPLFAFLFLFSTVWRETVLSKVWLQGGPLVPLSWSWPVLPRSRDLLILRSTGPVVSWSRASSVGFRTFCCVSVLALWLLWLPGLGVRWSPGQPILVPVVFWFSSPVLVVFWSPDALILWSSTLFVSQFLGLLVLWSSRSLVPSL